MAEPFLRDAHVVWRTTQLVYRNARLAQIMSVINASVLAWAIHDDVTLYTLLFWWAAVGLTALGRLWVAERFRLAAPMPAQAALWRKRFFVGVALSALCWSGGGVWIIVTVPGLERVFVALVLAGMLAGAVPILAPSPWALRAYAGMLMIPLFVFAALNPASAGIGFAVLLIMFVFTVLRSAAEYHHVLIETIGLDIEKGRLLNQLRQTSHNLEVASRAKDEFLANISHEIRTPMNGILGMAQLLAGQQLAPAQREQVEVIRGSTDALLTLVNGVLDFSRIEAGRFELAPAPFASADLLHDLERMFVPHAHAKGLVFQCAIETSVPGQLFGDVTRLKQILVNLLSNALKFTATGSVTLTLTARRQRLPQRVELIAHVRDTGPGVPLEKRQEIFLPFSQGDSSVTRQFGGTGLGLTIAQRLVSLMGGRLWVDDNPGGGSVFIFHVWLREEAGPPLDNELQDAPRTASMNVLVVDDNAVNCLVARRFLEKLGHQVSVAKDGAEALEMITHTPFDVVFMDVQMPIMDGLAATHRLRQLESAVGARHLPVIALSANATEADREACLEAGMDDFVEKPVRQPALEAAITRVLR